MVHDVAIVGAGPSGVAAALGCARAGLDVLLLDRALFPRDKPCGEGLLSRAVFALQRLGLHARIAAHGRTIEGITLALPTGVSAELTFAAAGLPPGIGIERRVLDTLLIEEARAQSSIEVQEGCEVWAIRHAADAMELITSAGTVAARAVVIAEGLRATLACRLGLARPPLVHDRSRFGLRVHFELPRRAPTRVEVLLEPGLEHYVTPVGARRLQVAVLGERRRLRERSLTRTTLVDRLRTHPKMGPLLTGAEPIDRPLGAGPFARTPKARFADGVLLVGDAAGYADAITGEGVGLALVSGLAAAAVLAEALSASRAVPAAAELARYGRALRSETRASNLLTRWMVALSGHESTSHALVFMLSKYPNFFAFLARTQAGQKGLAMPAYPHILIPR